MLWPCFFFQAEDGIRDPLWSRGLGDVYKRQELQWNPKVALGVVMAAGGYPYSYEKGHPIEGLPTETENLKVFHAGTQAQNNVIKTDGGRVLCVTALGKNTTEAQLNAYNCVEEVSWKDCFYRTDIGYRAIERES